MQKRRQAEVQVAHKREGDALRRKLVQRTPASKIHDLAYEALRP